MIVKAIVRNRRTFFPDRYPHEVLKKYFQFHPPNYQFMPMYKRFVWNYTLGRPERLWDGYIQLLKRRKVGTGLFLEMKEKIEKETKIQFEIIDKRRRLKFNTIPLDGARPYQIKCLNAMRKCITGGIILCPTGSGKTRIAGWFFQSLDGYGVFVVDELTLLEQARSDIAEVMGEPVGKIGNSEFIPKRITVATIQTLHRHRNTERYAEWVSKLKVIICDEVHVQMNKRNFDVIEDLMPRMVFGLTATLEIQKDTVYKRALNYFGPLIFKYDLEQGSKEGYLSRGIVCAVDMVQADKKSWTYNEAYNELIVGSEARNKLVTDITRDAHDRGHSVIILCDRIKHLKHLSHVLKDLPHRVVYGEIHSQDRMVAKKDFDKKKTRLIIANKVFQKGISINTVDVIIDCTGLKSKNAAIQKYGRGVRLSDNKKGLLYFDIADRSIEFGASMNRFEKAADSRMKAFVERSIPTFQFDDTSKLVVRAEKKLNRILEER